MADVYDLMLMLDTGATDEQRAKILSDAEAAVAAEGSIVSKHDWGVRSLAYEIRHQADADYHLLQFTGTPALLERLGRTLRLTDGVVRFRIIKLAPGTPDPPALRAEPRSATPAPEPAPAPEPEPERAQPEAVPPAEGSPEAEPAPAGAEAPAEATAPE